MPKNTNALVREFHETFRAAVGTEASINTGFESLRFRLIREEVAETLHAIMSSDEVEFADGLGDVDYVVEGAAITFGIDLQENFDKYLAYRMTKDIGELIGSLVLFVRFLGKTLTDEESRSSEDAEGYDVDTARELLTSIKAIVWAIATKEEIPLAEVVAAIHESNMTKLGEDGKPIFNDYNKVIKGPNYVPPTNRIKEILGV